MKGDTRILDHSSLIVILDNGSAVACSVQQDESGTASLDELDPVAGS